MAFINDNKQNFILKAMIASTNKPSNIEKGYISLSHT